MVVRKESMKRNTQTRKEGEAQMKPNPMINKTRSLFTAKNVSRIGFWNVRTLNQEPNIEILARIAKKYKIDLLGISETHLIGQELKNVGDRVLLLSGSDEHHRHGVGLMLSNDTAKLLTDWKAGNNRLMTARFKTKHCKITVIQCFAPTEPSASEIKDNFYEILQDLITTVPKNDVLIVMGDLNAKLGSPISSLSLG